MSTIVFGSCGLSVCGFRLPWSLWLNVEHQMAGSGYPPLPNDHDGFSCGAHKSVFIFRYTTNHHLDRTFHFQGLRLFDVRVILTLVLRSKGGLGSSGPMIRRVPCRCSSSSPDCSSRRPVHTEVLLMKPSNRVLGSTPTR